MTAMAVGLDIANRPLVDLKGIEPFEACGAITTAASKLAHKYSSRTAKD